MRFNILVFLVLGGLTLADVRWEFQYRSLGKGTAVVSWDVSNANLAYVDQGGKRVTLASPDKTKKISVYKRIDRPAGIRFVRLSGELSCRDVALDGTSVNRGLFYLIQYDSAGKGIRGDRIVAALGGTRDWRFFRKVFRLDPGAVRLKAGAQLNRCPGELTLRNVRITPVTEVLYYQWVKGLMLFAWGLFFYSLVKTYVGLCRPKAVWILVVCFAVILTGTTIPDGARDWMLTLAGVDLPAGDLSSTRIGGLALDEWIHFLGFGLFGAVLILLTPEIPLWLTGLCLVMYSFGTEMVQVFVESRTPKVFDGLVNTSGWLLGVGLAAVVKSFSGWGQKGNESSGFD